MSEELQNEESTEFTQDLIELSEPVSENPEGTELATDTGDNQENKQVDDEAAKEAKRQAAFNKQYGEKKQAERERDALQAKLDEVNKASTPPPPQAGQFPNEFDYDTTGDFEQAKLDYHNNVQATSDYNARINIQNEQAQNAQIAAQQQQQDDDNKLALNLITEAKVNNISEEEVQQHAQAVINYGVQVDTFRAIVSDKDGSLMLKHLAGNSQEVATLNSMSLIDQGAYIANVLKPKAVELKPTTTSTPNPPTKIEGGGADPDANRFPLTGGATIE